MRRALPWLSLVFAVAAAPAGTEIVLRDGQTIRCTQVRRDRNDFVVVLESGGLLTLPVDLVAQLRLSEGIQPAAPPPSMPAEPRQLAGLPITALEPAEAQASLGPPVVFHRNIVNPEWQPQSGFPEGDVLAAGRSRWRPGVVDPTWTPQSGFDGEDVLAGGRSTWSRSIIDNRWTPQDGFKKKATWQSARTGPPVQQTAGQLLAPTSTPDDSVALAGLLPRADPRRSPTVPKPGFEFKVFQPNARSAAVRSCGERVLAASSVAQPAPVGVEAVDERSYAGLPIEVFESSGVVRGAPRRAVFTVAGEQCRAISGDLEDSRGVRLSDPYAVVRGVEAYNAALAGLARGPRLSTDPEKIEYAFAVSSLVDPAVNGHGRATLVLLEDGESVRALAGHVAAECSVSVARRRAATESVARKFARPTVKRESRGDLIEFFAWSSAGGEVLRHVVRLSPEGKVSLERKSVAAHVGAHRDR